LTKFNEVKKARATPMLKSRGFIIFKLNTIELFKVEKIYFKDILSKINRNLLVLRKENRKPFLYFKLIDFYWLE